MLPSHFKTAVKWRKARSFGGVAGAAVGATTSYVGVIPGTLVGALFGASYGAYIDSQASLSDQLINRGATIVELGDQIMVAIPSARLFDGMSDRIKPPAYSTMNLLATYINSHTTMLVRIAAYTDDIGSRSTNVALSRQQAQSVARYLTAKGVNTRLLYAEGYGGTNLVARNVENEDWGKSDNYRIEITMEKLQAKGVRHDWQSQ